MDAALELGFGGFWGCARVSDSCMNRTGQDRDGNKGKSFSVFGLRIVAFMIEGRLLGPT